MGATPHAYKQYKQLPETGWPRKYGIQSARIRQTSLAQNYNMSMLVCETHSRESMCLFVYSVWVCLFGLFFMTEIFKNLSHAFVTIKNTKMENGSGLSSGIYDRIIKATQKLFRFI